MQFSPRRWRHVHKCFAESECKVIASMVRNVLGSPRHCKCAADGMLVNTEQQVWCICRQGPHRVYVRQHLLKTLSLQLKISIIQGAAGSSSLPMLLLFVMKRLPDATMLSTALLYNTRGSPCLPDSEITGNRWMRYTWGEHWVATR